MSDTAKSNVIVGPWKRHKKATQSAINNAAAMADLIRVLNAWDKVKAVGRNMVDPWGVMPVNGDMYEFFKLLCDINGEPDFLDT